MLWYYLKLSAPIFIIISHPNLSSVYPSLQDELLLNTLYRIDQPVFCNLFNKAKAKHEMGHIEYKDVLTCKQYKKQYQIIRNDPIGICHILVLIIYTDLVNFTTAFRRIYRELDGETTTKQAEDRHQQLYHFSRYLFEAVHSRY